MNRFLSLGTPFAVAALVAVLAGSLGYRIRILPLGPAFIAFGLGLLVAIIAAGISLVGVVLVLVKGARPDYGLGRAVLGLVIAGLIIAVPGRLLMSGGQSPIHDVTTDTEDPPVFVDVLPLRADAPNTVEYGGEEVAAFQRSAYPDLVSLTLAVPPEQAFDRALAAVQEMGWPIAGSSREDGRIEATDTTFWFGFEDDVVIRLRADAGGTRVDVRSLSRVGGGDAGANANRIRAYLARLRDTTAP